MTSKGARLLGQIQKVARIVNAEIMTGISPSDVSRVETILHRMKDQLIAMDAVPGGSGNSHDHDE